MYALWIMHNNAYTRIALKSIIDKKNNALCKHINIRVYVFNSKLKSPNGTKWGCYKHLVSQLGGMKPTWEMARQ